MTHLEGDVSDLGPGEAYAGGEFVVLLVHVYAEGVHTQQQVRAFLVLDGEVGDPVHVQVLRYLQVLALCLFTQHSCNNT